MANDSAKHVSNDNAAIEIQVMRAFVEDTERGEGGNPAGVVFAADGLDETAMQAVARAAGFSETAFVSASSVADFRFDFFTPTRRIAHCGHATIAAFAHMAATGQIGPGRTSKETVDGPRAVVIEGDMAFMEQTAPVYSRPGTDWTTAEALDALGLKETGLAEGLDPMVVNTGNSFLIVPVADRSVLAALAPDTNKTTELSDRLGLVGVYPFATDTVVPGRDATTRMFAPAYGIPEESATGMAAGPLAAYLHDHMGRRQNSFLIEQGHFMSPPSPSILTARLTPGSDGAIANLMVGGRARTVETIRMPLNSL